MRVDYNEYIQSEEWRQRADAAKQRVGHRCQVCNRPAPRVALTVHHRTYERLGHEQPEDLTVLCRGCHELYERNRRIPDPPSAQPGQQPKPTETPTRTRPPSTTTAATVASQLRTPFVPATEDHQRAKLHPYRSSADSPVMPADIYQLASDKQAHQTEQFYHLATDRPVQPASQPNAQRSNKRGKRARRTLSGLAIVGLLVLLLVLNFADAIKQASIGLRLPAPTDRQLATATQAQPSMADVAPAIPTSTLLPPTPTLLPTVLPAVLPTVLPSAAAPPTSVPTTVNPASQIVKQSALVCGMPCSCAPVVRTIPGGTAVTVLDTMLCDGNTWYQIGEHEWLGPRLLVDQS